MTWRFNPLIVGAYFLTIDRPRGADAQRHRFNPLIVGAYFLTPSRWRWKSSRPLKRFNPLIVGAYFLTSR